MAQTADQASATLTQLYLSSLGRTPDAATTAVLLPQLEAGADPAVIRTQLVTGSLEATYLVNQYYHDLLGRAPDQPSFDATLAALAAGAIAMPDLRTQLASSTEAQVAIGTEYFSVLGRHADVLGSASFLHGLASGGTLNQVRQALASSPEEATRLGSMYQQVLGRAVTTPELAADVSVLSSGQQSFFDILQDLAYSDEAKGAIASSYQSLLGRAPTAAESAAASFSFTVNGSLPFLQATLAGMATALNRIAAAYELNFGVAPAASTLATLHGEISLGRSFADTTQVTANFVSRSDAFFTYNYGYAVPAQYSATGAAQFVAVYQNTNPLQIGAQFTTITVPTTGATISGPDTIQVNLATIGSAPVSFTATLDGVALGGATITTIPRTSPFQPAPEDQVTFTGNFGPGLHDLHIQVVGDPLANQLVIPGPATFNGNQFLLGHATTDASGGTDIFPHAGPQPPIVYAPGS